MRFSFLLLWACSGDHVYTKLPSEMWVTPQMSDVGEVVVGSSHTVAFEVEATQSGQINVLSVEIDNVQGDYCSVGSTLGAAIPNQPAVIEIEYEPADVGYHRCIATIETDSITPFVDVEVRGRALVPSVRRFPSLIDFGAVEVGATRTEQIYLENTGPIDVSITTGVASEGSFFIMDDLPFLLLADSETPLNIQFIPLSDDPIQAELFLVLEDGQSIDNVTLRANDCENGLPEAYDVDADGVKSCSGDCDDNNPDVSPMAEEQCNGIDEDCDGLVDENTTCFDDDGDGFTEEEGDCNDSDPNMSPDSIEIEDNGVDDNCDGNMDPSASDNDGDGYAASSGDCDDTSSAVSPAMSEVMDGIDNNCNGIVDEGTAAYDDDGDGYTELQGDCNDTNPSVYLAAPEIANGMDDDCDNLVDEGTEGADDDGDGFTELGGDCDDSDPNINPSQLEVFGDGADNDCDGLID
jgi:hypothetical protein